MYNENCWSKGESISLHLLHTEISDLELYLSTKKDLLSNPQYILALEKYDITNESQSNKIFEIIVSLQQISGPGIDESNLIDLLIYFTASPTYPYKVAGYNQILAEAMSQLDTYHHKRTSSLDNPMVQSIPVIPVVLSSLSPNATPFCPCAEVSQKKEAAIDCLSKGSSVHGYVTSDEPAEIPQLNLNQEKTMNVEHPITVKIGFEDKREALPLQVDPDLENYRNINSLGVCKRARAHLLRDLAKESDNWENDDEYLDDRHELAMYDFEISLLTQRIERYELSLSLSGNLLHPPMLHLIIR